MTNGTTLRAALVVATVAGTLATAGVAQAQVTIDFTTTDGGFTQQTLVGANPWTRVDGEGWRVAGAEGASGVRSRLLSPVLTATGGLFSVDARHAFEFQRDGIGGACLDGGAVFASINGGSFVQLAPTGGVGYTAAVADGANPLAGLQAFCGSSGGLISSIFSATLAAGTTVQVALDGGWDAAGFANGANWRLESVTVNLGDAQSVVPEPSTYALLGTGLAGLGVVARRRRRA